MSRTPPLSNDSAPQVGISMDESEYKSSTNKSKVEKRKSEVLIAAQSLDNELQNVKNLKRLSIGSMDLLIDPEMEFRVNTSPTHVSVKSDSPSGESLANGSSSDEFEDGDEFSYVDDSIDITGAEYLQEHNELSSVQQRYAPLSVTTGSPSKRNLSGVRRGGNLSNKVPLGEDGTSNNEDSFTQNLLWVPANQHPGVKPENYLNLVQDTLHNLQLDSAPQTEGDKQNKVDSGSTKLILESDSDLSKQLVKRHNSLVRRPSRLRKSYTEFEDLLENSTDNSNHNDENSQVYSEVKTARPTLNGSRSVSLKDITEELTKISNKAGLTDSDAVTLARTLSMAGSYQSAENQDEDGHTAEIRGEEEYASSMLTKNGLAIPARSSLRRSKFNTYRIRSPSGGSVGSSNLGMSNLDYQEPVEKVGSSSKAILQSPSSLNDVNDIYDHYRQPSLDGSVDLNCLDQSGYDSPIEELIEDSHTEIADDSDGLSDSNDFSSDSSIISAHRGREPIIIQEQLEQVSDATQSHAKSKSHRKKGGWNWFNKKSSRDQEFSSDDEEEQKKSSDFLNINTSNNHLAVPISKVNHARHRHYSVGSPSISSEDPQVHESTESTSTMSKRQKREKKFIQLFKRRTSGSRKDKEVLAESKDSKPLRDGVKKQSSSTNLSKFRLSPKKQEKKNERSDRNQYAGRGSPNSSPRASDELQNDASPTGLQPSVCVTRRNIGKGPPAQTVSKKSSNASNVPVEDLVEDISVEDKSEAKVIASKSKSAHEVKDLSETQKADDEQVDKASGPVAPAVQPYALPPRKLTFDDVMKPERPNAPMQFADSAFGFPLPPLTVSTVIMFDRRLPINVERAIYRLSHLKLSDPKRELRQQVLLSNFMYAYLNLVNHSLFLQQIEENGGMAPQLEAQGAGTISIPEM